jgi:hypothetical protein
MLPVYPRQGRKKIFRQYGKDTRGHCLTVRGRGKNVKVRYSRSR